MFTLSSAEIIFVALMMFTFAFPLGFIIGMLYVKNVSNPAMLQRERREAKLARDEFELNKFYRTMSAKSDAWVPYLETLELIINDAISQLHPKESELVCSTYNYYMRLFNEAQAGTSIKREDLINFANIHLEYSRIVQMYENCKEIKITDFSNINLN